MQSKGKPHKIYLLSGKSQNGKDTIYELFKDEVNWKKVAFANKLKSVVADLYNLSFEQVHGSERDIEDTRYPNLIDPKYINSNGTDGREVIPNPSYKKFLTPRRILQIFGQQQRSLFPEIWASYVFNVEIQNLLTQGYDKFVVTDVRFKNEILIAEDYVRKTPNVELIKVRINRPGVIAGSAADDISEIDLDDYSDWDIVINNSGSIEDLKANNREAFLAK